MHPSTRMSVQHQHFWHLLCPMFFQSVSLSLHLRVSLCHCHLTLILLTSLLSLQSFSLPFHSYTTDVTIISSHLITPFLLIPLTRSAGPSRDSSHRSRILPNSWTEKWWKGEKNIAEQLNKTQDFDFKDIIMRSDKIIVPFSSNAWQMVLIKNTKNYSVKWKNTFLCTSLSSSDTMCKWSSTASLTLRALSESPPLWVRFPPCPPDVWIRCNFIY